MSERFGKYELLQRVGVGGMAEVWVARTFGAEGFVKELVIKRILEQFNEDEEFVSMFINEARLASRLQHANIVQIFDFDQVDGVYYIAMEFVDGPDLRKVVATARRRSMPIPQTLAVHVGIEVLKGLHYAHTRQDRGQPLGIVHRDISPHNLLLSYAGEVKITDFGIAKVAALASATRTGMLKGKLTYMSPEQVRADAVDARADLYALGIVIWELLAGRRRYTEVGSEGELVAAVRRGEVPHLADVVPGIDDDLARVVDRLLAPDPEDRFGSAAEALVDLSTFAGATDGLEVAEYLATLLPGGAVREQRGLTAAAPVAAAAAVDAATKTIDPDDAVDPDDAEVRDASSGEETRISDDEPSGVDGRGFIMWAWVLGIFLFVLLMSGALVFGLKASPGTRAPEVGILKIRSRPAGAQVSVDGVTLVGRGPHTLSARWGTRLSLAAKWAGAGRSRTHEIVMSSERQVVTLEKIASVEPRTSSGRPPGPSIDAGVLHRDAATASAAKSSDASAKKDGRGRHAVGRYAHTVGPGALREGGTGASRKGGEGSRPIARKRPSRRHLGATVSSSRSSSSKKDTARADKGTKKRPSEGRERPRRTFGMLTVQVSPWAQVAVDGRRIGLTPITRYRLRSGMHRVTLTNTTLGKHVKIKLEIEKGRVKLVRRDW